MLCSIMFFACSEDDATPVQLQQQQPQEEDPNENEPVAIEFTEFMAGSHQRGPIGNIYPAGNYVINSVEDWNNYHTYPGPVNSTPVPTTGLNFNMYTYIALRHDFQPHSSDAIKIYAQSVIQQNNQITVNYVKIGLNPGDVGFTIESHPFQIIKIPSTTLPINFIQVQP